MPYLPFCFAIFGKSKNDRFWFTDKLWGVLKYQNLKRNSYLPQNSVTCHNYHVRSKDRSDNPLRWDEMTVRNPLKYKVKKANTERLKVSTIPYMQRVLNDNYRKRKWEMKNLNNELNKSMTRKLEKNSKSLQVNYVSINDYHCRK